MQHICVIYVVKYMQESREYKQAVEDLKTVESQRKQLLSTVEVCVVFCVCKNL